MHKGKINQIIGPVVDIEFNEGELPAIYNAVKIIKSDGSKVILEVQQHLLISFVCLSHLSLENQVDQ